MCVSVWSALCAWAVLWSVSRPARALSYCGLWHCSAFLPCCSLERTLPAPHSLSAPVLLPSYSSRAAAFHVPSWCQLCHELMTNTLKQHDFHWAGKAGKLWCVLWITPWFAGEVLGWPSLKSLWLKCCLSFPSELAALMMRNWWEGQVNFDQSVKSECILHTRCACIEKCRIRYASCLSVSRAEDTLEWGAFRTHAFYVCKQFNQNKSFDIFGADNFSHTKCMRTWYAKGKLTSESVSSWYL